METLNIRLDGPGRFDPTRRLMLALEWSRTHIGAWCHVEAVELRRDTTPQVLVLQFRHPLTYHDCELLCNHAGVDSLTFSTDACIPYLWGVAGFPSTRSYTGPFFRIGDKEKPAEAGHRSVDPITPEVIRGAREYSAWMQSAGLSLCSKPRPAA